MALYRNLRRVMFEFDETQQDLAKITGRSQSYIGERMRGQRPYDMEDVYKICEHFNLELNDISKYFPLKGQ